MMFGAAACGERVMTTSSSPGISLMSEGISYIASGQCPAVFVNIMRGGPGLGGILPSQGDYFQATKGGGHGDYRLLVLAPARVQEAVEMVMMGFALAEKYRNPVMILGDRADRSDDGAGGFSGHLKTPQTRMPGPPTAWTHETARRNLVKSLYLDQIELNNHNLTLKAKYDRMKKKKSATRPTISNGLPGADCQLRHHEPGVQTAIDNLKAKGIEVGMIRPKRFFPFHSGHTRSSFQRKLQDGDQHRNEHGTDG